MTNERKEEIRIQLTALLEDEAFLTAVLSAGESEKISKVMQENGIKVTPEEIDEFMDSGISQLAEMKESGSDELSIEDLESVAGGGKLRGALRYALVIGGAVAVGAGLGVLVGAGALALGTAYAVGVGYAVIGGAWTLSGRAKKGW